jgi:hypothetical protein
VLIEIGVAAPGEIAHVADDKAIAINGRGDTARDIWRSVPIVYWRYCRPQHEKQGESGAIDPENAPSNACRVAGYRDKSKDQCRSGQDGANWFAGGAAVPDRDRTPGAG